MLLFVLDVSMLRVCEGECNTGVGDGGGVVAVSAGYEYVGSARGSDMVSCAADVLGMSVVCEMRGVGGVREMRMCLARVGVGEMRGEWIKGLCLGFTNSVETMGVLDVCLGCSSVAGVGGEWVGSWVGSRRVWWYYVYFSCGSGFFM